MVWFTKEKLPVTLLIYVDGVLADTIVGTRTVCQSREGFYYIEYDKGIRRVERQPDGTWVATRFKMSRKTALRNRLKRS